MKYIVKIMSLLAAAALLVSCNLFLGSNGGNEPSGALVSGKFNLYNTVGLSFGETWIVVIDDNDNFADGIVEMDSGTILKSASEYSYSFSSIPEGTYFIYGFIESSDGINGEPDLGLPFTDENDNSFDDRLEDMNGDPGIVYFDITYEHMGFYGGLTEAELDAEVSGSTKIAPSSANVEITDEQISDQQIVIPDSQEFNVFLGPS